MGRSVQLPIRRGLLTAAAAAAVCVFAAVAVSFAVPLAAVAAKSVSAVARAVSSGGEAALYPFRIVLRITAFTLAQALASTLLAVLIGIPAAFFTARRNFFGRKFLLSLSSVPLCVPPLIMALGYVAAFGMAGHVNRMLEAVFSLSEPPLTFLYSAAGIVTAQGFYNFPLIMSAVSDVWGTLPPEQADAARLLGAGRLRVFRTVTLFQLLPAVVSACIPVFLYCFFAFMTVLLFGGAGCTTLEVAVYHSARSTLDFSGAAILALVETLCALCAVGAYSAAGRNSERSRGVSFGGGRRSRRSVSGREAAPAAVFFLTVGVFFLLPLASILLSSLTGRGGSSARPDLSVWRETLSSAGFLRALGTTILVAAAVSAVSTVTACVCACALRCGKPFSGGVLARTVPLLPMAVSSVVMGLGITLTVRRGTPALLVLAQSALSWPFAFRQIHAHLARIPDSVIDSARTLGACGADTVFRVLVPYSAGGIIRAAGFCFAVSAGDTALPLVLAIPGFDTLALFTYRLAGSYRIRQACAAGLVLGILCSAVTALADRFKDRAARGGGR